MRTIIYFPIFLLFVYSLSGCSNDDDAPYNPASQLPPATQTGENTFGCLLDGEAFLPAGGINSLDCVYQFVDGGYYFALQGNKREENYNFIGLAIGTIRLEIQEGVTYELKEKMESNAYGRYYFGDQSTGESQILYTSNLYSGELTITKLDFDNNIISGTFWFNIKDENGVIHKIREGRFDMQFTE